jgi:hypothetical protein
MDIYTVIIFIAPYLVPFFQTKIFEFSSRSAFGSFVIYYNLWLYFLAYDLASPYFICLVYLLSCLLLLAYFLYYPVDKASPFVGHYKFCFVLSGCLLMIGFVFGYEEIKWFNINLLILQSMCLFFDCKMARKLSYNIKH